MAEKYTRNDMRKILKQDIGTSVLTEQKIQEAYAYIRREAALSQEAESSFNKVVFYPQEEQDTGEKIRRYKNTGLRDNYAKNSGHLRIRKWMMAAAAVGILMISSLTVMAVNGFFTKTMTEENGTVDYKFKIDYELTMNEITITPGYIPEGYEKMTGDALKYCTDGEWQNGISIGLITTGDLVGRENMTIENIKNVEKTVINGMEAHILLAQEPDMERWTSYFDKQILLFNPEEGYVASIWGGNDITLEELKKVAEGLTFTKTDGEIDLETIKEEQEGKETQEELNEKWMNEAMESWNYGVPKEHVLQIGQSSQVYGLTSMEDSLLKITVKSVEICDSIAGLPTENFTDYENLQRGLNEDGTLKPYKRLVMERQEDGSYQETAREEVTQKFVKLSMQAENPTTEMQEFWAGMPIITWLEPKEDGSYAYSDLYIEPLNFQEYHGEYDGMPIYFDQSGFTEELRKHFLFRELQPQEVLEYTLIYLVDEDRLDNMYLNVQGNSDGKDSGYDPVSEEFLKDYIDLNS